MNAVRVDEHPVTAVRHIVLMDLDGAVLDSSVQHALAWQEAFSPCGFRPSQHQILAHIAQHGPESMPPGLSREHLRVYGEAVRAMYRAIYTRYYLPVVRPVPEAVDLIQDLKQQGLQVAVTSTGPATVMATALERLGLSAWVDATVTQDDLNGGQPDRYRAALDKLRASVEEAVVIGATLYSLRAARRADLPFIAAGPPVPPYQTWAEAGVMASFADYAALRAGLHHLLPASAPDAWLTQPARQRQRVLHPQPRVVA